MLQYNIMTDKKKPTLKEIIDEKYSPFHKRLRNDGRPLNAPNDYTIQDIIEGMSILHETLKEIHTDLARSNTIQLLLANMYYDVNQTRLPQKEQDAFEKLSDALSDELFDS